jgi:hypothetical protein
MNRAVGFMILGLGVPLVGMTGLGCHDNSPPPPRVAVPSERQAYAPPPPPREAYAPSESARKPVENNWTAPTPGYDDQPLVNQRPPEQRAFIDAYNRVGRPRLTVFINRTLEGDLLPVNNNDPILSVEQSRKSNTGVTVERKDSTDSRGYYRDHHSESTDKFESKGPAEYREKTEIYLRPGEYDEVSAKTLDYNAVENIMTDWLAANGQTTMISPGMARERLTDDQLKDLQSGRPRVMSEIVRQLGVDVLIQVQAHPTRQTAQGLEVRIIAEAINTRGGQSIGRAVVDVPPPLTKTTINTYTRFLARKLMDDMSNTWTAMANNPPPPPAPPANAPPPPPRTESAPPPPPQSEPPSVAVPKQ